MRGATLPTLVALACLAVGAAWADDAPVRIGVLNDTSTAASEQSGTGSIEAARMAAAEFGPTVLGRRIGLLTGDHQMKPDLGLSIARQWYDRDKVDAIFDVPNSAIAFGVQGLARQFNRLVVFSSAGSVDLTEKNCDPHSITWTYDTCALARTAAAEAKAGGKSWHFVTADYVFGKQLEADAARFVKAAGGQVLGVSRQPINAADFGQPLVEAQASGAQVLGIANVGLDMVNTVKQAAEFGLTAKGKMRAVALFATEQEIAGLGLALGQGMEFATPFYWGMTPAALDWDKRFYARTRTIPSMNQIGTYEAVLQYLRAVQAAGTTEFEPVRAKLREMRIETPFTQGGWVRDDGRVMRPMHIVRVKAARAVLRPHRRRRARPDAGRRGSLRPGLGKRLPVAAQAGLTNEAWLIASRTST